MLVLAEPAALVLIVEDEFLIANDLGDILESAGYQVLGLAESATQARALVAESRPSVVLLDIFLKGEETGIDLAHWLNQQHIPFVFLSANLTDDVLAAAKVTEPFGFLNKPFRERDVLAALEIARYRQAHSQEAKLRQQQQTQIAVNEAIVTLHDREQLCQAIATQVNQFVRIDVLNLCLSQPEEQIFYWLLLRRTPTGTFKRVRLPELFGPGTPSERLSLQEHPMAADPGNRQGVFSGEAFETLSQEFSMAQAIGEAFGIQSMAFFPVVLQQRTFTSLQLGTTAAAGFTPDEYAAVSFIIPQIALALDNLLAYEELENRRQIKATELAIASAFRNGRNIVDIAPQVAAAISELLPLDLLSFYRVGRVLRHPGAMDATVGNQGGHFQLLPLEAMPLPNTTEEAARLLDGMDAWLQQPLLHVGEKAAQARELNPVTRYYGNLLQLKSSMSVPIMLKGEPVVVLIVASKAAYAYTAKDLQLLQELTEQLAVALDNLLAYERIRQLSEQLEQEKTYLSEELKTSHNFEEIIGTSPALLEVLRGVGQVAPTDATVLLLGETGTGKELIARAVHNRSPRSARTMVKVNCAALPAQLIESELFGHEKGSYTGATERRVGKFELAHGSTLFLDEIGELPLELQAKLLRVLQEKEIERLGGKGPLKVDVRIIAATNRELAEEVAAGRFRADLYYRLNVFPLELPPLRTRPEDLLPLATYFLRKLSQKLGKPFTSIANASLQQIQHYAWPGNIRELENVLERAAILSAPPTLQLAAPLVSSAPPRNEVKPMQDTMRDTILAALTQTNYRIRGPRGAAVLLGVKATTLEARMKKLGIASRKESRAE
ncbi:sigma 54-interacting transcriptional regulator [Hymenobacter sp. YC55]|uniref:sigma 54-interacting transcriptional regulator n=1 Tax=Hymenobacter sp. YC55 TaxID=3034019 RepID=UPI0023FA4848|nr:sigma 54-interacting transcriptional regulator [Hymenobacter sp. YC55]MDF7814067.1 sigma 54-interacting transcriptional regulator [Hymenobacter sp. YC55]